jgi:hypothetical protein
MWQPGHVTILEFIGLGEGTKAARRWVEEKSKESEPLPEIRLCYLARHGCLDGNRGREISKRRPLASGFLRIGYLINLSGGRRSVRVKREREYAKTAFLVD